MDFPFLGAELDNRDGLRGDYLSCWIHCLRDVLYSAGASNVVRHIAQPLNFAIERDRRGFLINIYGGQDTYYFEPFFRFGLDVSWQLIGSGDEAENAIRSGLALGQAQIVNLASTRMRHSKYFGYSRLFFEHSVIVYAIDDQMRAVSIADTSGTREARFLDNRGVISLDDFRLGLHNVRRLNWSTNKKEQDWASQLHWLIANSISNMQASRSPDDGLAGLENLADSISILAGSRQRRSRARTRIASVIQKSVSGDRALIARALETDADFLSTGIDTIALLRRLAGSWADLARMIFVFRYAWDDSAIEFSRRAISDLHRLETAVCEKLVSHMPQIANRLNTKDQCQPTLLLNRKPRPSSSW